MEDSAGRIIAELVTPYPPGIPITVPGEVMTHECVDYMVFMRDHGADLQESSTRRPGMCSRQGALNGRRGQLSTL